MNTKLTGLTYAQQCEIDIVHVPTVSKTKSTRTLSVSAVDALDAMTAYKQALMDWAHPSIRASYDVYTARMKSEGRERYIEDFRRYGKSFRLSHMTAASSVIRKLRRLVDQAVTQSGGK